MFKENLTSISTTLVLVLVTGCGDSPVPVQTATVPAALEAAAPVCPAKEECSALVSAFAGIDVDEVRTNDIFRFALPKPIGEFKNASAMLDFNGTARQILSHAKYPAMAQVPWIVSQVEQLVPEIAKRLDCKLVDSGKDQFGRQKWTFAFSKPSEWKIELGVGQNGATRPYAYLSILRPSFVDKLTETESERVPIPTEAPKGDIGNGQDEKWVRATFPKHADMIIAKGYENWLMEWVGIMRQNGHYKAMIHIDSLTNGPCTLTCGPYRVHVTQPGVYSFPLEVFTNYDATTEPPMVLRVDKDEGFRTKQWFYDQAHKNK